MSVNSLFITFALIPAALAALPKGWKACSMSASDYEKCLLKEAGNAIHTLMNGDKKFGLLPLDPLVIQSLDIPQGTGPVAVNLSFRDLQVSGIRQFSLNSATNDWKELTAEAYLPEMMVLGNYKVEGKVLVLPITGNGKCNLTFDQTTFKIKVHFKQIENGGKKYFQMEKFLLDIIPKKLYIQLDNLFNGDKALGDNMNNFLNENWEQILNELKPGVTDGLSQAFTIIANKVLGKIPSEDIDKK